MMMVADEVRAKPPVFLPWGKSLEDRLKLTWKPFFLVFLFNIWSIECIFHFWPGPRCPLNQVIAVDRVEDVRIQNRLDSVPVAFKNLLHKVFQVAALTGLVQSLYQCNFLLLTRSSQTGGSFKSFHDRFWKKSFIFNCGRFPQSEFEPPCEVVWGVQHWMQHVWSGTLAHLMRDWSQFWRKRKPKQSSSLARVPPPYSSSWTSNPSSSAKKVKCRFLCVTLYTAQVFCIMDWSYHRLAVAWRWLSTLIHLWSWFSWRPLSWSIWWNIICKGLEWLIVCLRSLLQP